MKKFLAIIVTALIILTAIAVPTFAYGRGQQTNYVDTNKDGVCDNRNASCKAQDCANKNANFVDSDKDGICDNRPASGKSQSKTNSNKGSNFIDADKNGICDNRTFSGKGNCRGRNR